MCRQVKSKIVTGCDWLWFGAGRFWSYIIMVHLKNFNNWPLKLPDVENIFNSLIYFTSIYLWHNRQLWQHFSRCPGVKNWVLFSYADDTVGFCSVGTK